MRGTDRETGKLFSYASPESLEWRRTRAGNRWSRWRGSDTGPDNCLPALVDRDVLHRHLLLTAGSVSLQGLYLDSERPRQLVERPLGAVLLWDVVHIVEAAGKRHGGHVHRGHLGR